ncbi:MULTISPECIES: DotH/IcmK family type IV secretion protein [Legionella]|uniref:Type IV secretion protein IcmK n=1 Tax=Legionella septentrionalis TaxID=2498109 RepID=A0A3S1CLC9_9GAMM|nr:MULTISPECIES: DotH/IcmK family type IV secretion protein [Legionella]MCP0913192.1 DotH/IcmK family type IV secretion protein [Legionella sp. 27cVA30]RUQ88048.1 type IV secretion protein IcmK [Legionella septentrionalis]RUR10371.1 type IV secretion protein IcmK [Legionella septentrionalis]RUR17085.1 type IV secretion protein IcmK [Legionella septentrionalis]
MRSKKYIVKAVFFIAVFCFSITGSAEQADSAQQALEQLRMLQQRLSTSPESEQATVGQVETNAAAVAATPRPAAAPTAPPPAPAATPANNAESDTVTALTPVDKESFDSMAFDEVTEQLFPLNPEQIVRLKQMQQTQEFAQASPAGTPPKPTATSQIVNLSPGSTPPVIRLSQGFVSSLVFLDSTGAPWPISAYDLGDPSSFNIQWDKTSNTLMIQALKVYTYGNLAVRLRGLNTPVMLTLIPGQKAVDYRVDLRIQGYGPNAKNMPLEVGIPPAANDLLLNVLDGVPPPGSTRLTISGGDARAWLLNEKMYVRTNLTILSPGWIGSMTSADGMHAYEMQKSPVLLVSWHGKVMQLKVEGL